MLSFAPPKCKNEVHLVKKSMPFEPVLFPIFPIFPLKNIYSFEDQWINGRDHVISTSFPRLWISGSVDQWISGSMAETTSFPRHFHVISTSFPRHFHILFPILFWKFCGAQPKYLFLPWFVPKYLFLPWFVPKYLLEPNLSKFYWLCLFVCFLI